MRVKEEVTSNETDQQLWVSHLRRIKRLEWSKSDAYYWNKELINNKWKIIVNSTTTFNTMNCYCYHRAFVSLHLWKLRQVFASSAVYDEWRRGSNIYRYFFDYSDDFIYFDILNIKFFIKIIDPIYWKEVLAYIRIRLCYLAHK